MQFDTAEYLMQQIQQSRDECICLPNSETKSLLNVLDIASNFIANRNKNTAIVALSGLGWLSSLSALCLSSENDVNDGGWRFGLASAVLIPPIVALILVNSARGFVAYKQDRVFFGLDQGVQEPLPNNPIPPQLQLSEPQLRPPLEGIVAELVVVQLDRISEGNLGRGEVNEPQNNNSSARQNSQSSRSSSEFSEIREAIR